MHAIRLLKNMHRFPEIITARRLAVSWLPLAFRYLGVTRGSYPYAVALRNGAHFHLEGREELKVFWNIFFRSCYHADRDDHLILDVGANIGMFAIWIALTVPDARIFSLEPWPSTYRRLIRHIEMNGLADRVVPVNLALAGECGWRQLVGNEGESCANKIQLDKTISSIDAPSHKVPLATCRTLEAVLEDLRIDTLDLLKMDIEGSEYETLLATPPSVLRRIKKINLEYHEVPAHLGYSKEQLFAHLREAGHVADIVVEDEFHTGVALFRRAGTGRFSSRMRHAACSPEGSCA